MANYQATPPQPAAADPGNTLGLVGLILGAGVVASVIAARREERSGKPAA